MPKRSSTGRKDLNQLAKSIVDQATAIENKIEDRASKKKAASSKGGVKGGKSRMDALTFEQRRELAKKAAEARWKNTAPAVEAGAGATRSAKQH